ncbi:FG-GAP-like repeat-containing protein [Bradyrhizobium sp. CCGUVB14]|uniref:FG-GAP-like repeat-containing protein n=1 Tax=Bradyrhizobium sp. CCGUVB14 TaxID=2949628 RepID=UPI0020B17D4E|nr:FG-GAP-like repeat-containing protein [Bradyrhizobium sp. CCGUVB14]MCP3445772.1 Ig-like domain-containing protein [Bradyrhizobium sp. CCGUVB14]
MTTTPSHIVVLSLENENYSDIVGSSQAPYLNSLISQGMLLTNYYGVTHPSQPNYIALFSGSTQGVTSNGAVAQLPASVPTLASTLAAHGYTFGGYAETTADPERQPWMDFANSANDGHDFSTFPQTAAGFANLPTVSFVSPNDAHNMTPTSDNGGGIPAGDAWVQANLSAYAAWAQANNSLLIITFDENNTNPAVTYPDHIAGIVVGAGVPAGSVNDSPADQYSLLATIESLYGAAPIGASAGVPALNFYSATPPTSSTSVDLSFSGLSDLTNTPPQNALAVGSNYILTAETTHYEITDLSGHPIVSNGSLSTLFSPLGATLDNRLLDARAAYDSSTGHYVIIAENFQPGTGNFATNIDIAVSVDSNPNDGWYLASIDTSNGNTTQADMPFLSVSNGKIYISTPEYLDAGGGYNNGEFVVNESSVIAAGNAAITPDASQSVSPTGGIARNIAGDNGETYYLSTYSTGRETGLTYQTYDPTHGFSGTQTLFLGDADVGGGGNNFTAAQLGTTKTLDINDGRLQSLAYTSSGGHNYVFGVSEVMPSAGAPAEIEWFKLDVTDPTNPQFVIGNVISGASIGAGVAVFNPSIAVDQNGDVLINFSASGSNMYPADYYTVLGAGASAFTAPTLYQASTTFFDSGALNDQRWGTYSTAIADPNNPGGFWISNEYIANGWWQTAVAQVSVHPDTTPPAAPTGLSLDATTDSATIGDRITNFTHVKIDGTAEAGSTVTLYDSNGTTVLGTGTANLTTGAFSITTSALADGTHNITAKATDAWGNTSIASAVLAVMEDTTAPTGGTPDLTAASDTGVSSTDNITKDTTPTFQVALDPTVQAGDTVELKLGGASLTHPLLHTITAGDVSAGSVQLTVTAGDLGADGTKSITAVFDDAAGNSSTTAALMITLDTTIATPTVALTDDTGISDTDHITRDDALTISAAAGDVTRTYSVDGGLPSASYVAPVMDGSHTVVVTDTDTAGNTASASITFTLDQTDVNFGTSGGISNLLLQNDTSHGIAVWEMNGTTVVANPQIGTAPSGSELAATGDFNGDGKADLLFINDTSHAVTMWEMNGTQVATNATVGTINAAAGWQFEGTGDFNGDGKTDLLLFNDNSDGVAIWEMNGTQVMANPQIGVINGAAGWHFADTGDFNGDGKTDLLLLNSTTHGVAVWEMNGSQVMANPQIGTINAAAGWQFEGTGDFNGDGKTDLLLVNSTTNGVAVWEMNGTQVMANPQIGTINAAAGWHFADTGDFNGDGKTDLLLLNSTTGGVAVWQMNGTQVTANPQVGVMDPGFQYVGKGDYNGDGRTDLLFENNATHALQVWEMNGTQVEAKVQIGTINAAADWHLVS